MKPLTAECLFTVTSHLLASRSLSYKRAKEPVAPKYRALLLLAAALVLPCMKASAADTRPNIIVMLVDDMGFSDLGCYGSEIPTPNLDSLAAGGLRFKQFYNTGRCCPTRASLLTGLYSHQTGVGHMTSDNGVPGFRGHLNNSCVTFAEVLKPAGYFTAMTGKWHVGQNLGVTPWGRGFERHLTAPAGGFYLKDSPRASLFLNGEAIKNDDPRLPSNWYSTDLWTTYGLKFIDEALSAKQPFFLYLAHNAPHFPLQAPAEDIAKFRGKYKAGWDATSEARLKRQIELGLIDKSWQKAPRPEKVRQWNTLSAEEKDRFDEIMAVYAACVYHLDKSVGDLIKGLKERGVFENTLIFFMSDNGGNAESGPEGRNTGDPSKADSNWYCGESWAHTENTPFRLYKHFNHEGGISTPLIMHWPEGIKAKNEWRSQPTHLIDIMPTCVELARAVYPKKLNGHAITPLEGRSLVPVFANKPVEREALFWEHEGNAAVRVGDWKLVRRGAGGAWELYDLQKDRTEMRNLAAANPERVQQMNTLWNDWAKRANVIPGPRSADPASDSPASPGKAGKKKAKKA